MPENVQSNIAPHVEIEISEDKMSAYILVEATEGEKPQPITANDLYYELDNAGVKYGILDEVINDLTLGKKRGEKVLIAAGHEPID